MIWRASLSLPAPPRPPVPAQLPAPVRGLGGREAELARLDELAAAARCAASRPPLVAASPPVVAVSGTAGAGKTALAVRWAHRALDWFPDGQLYVDLRGFDARPPVCAYAALGGFLRALGVAADELPSRFVDRIARYRQLVAGRLMLIVLDNADAPGHVLALLPDSPSCFTLITSRAAVDDFDRCAGLALGPLTAAAATEVLVSLIGQRAERDREAAAALATYCAGLPLALRSAAGYVANRPGIALSTLVRQLASERWRLAALDAEGDPRTALRAAFSWSYRRLPAPAALMFRRLGLHPGGSVAVGAMAALVDGDVATAVSLLETLRRASLVWRTPDGRYATHGLLRAYARDLLAQDGAAERQAAVLRMFDLAATASSGRDWPVTARPVG